MSAERIKSWPTKERLRERLLAEGPERLTDADLLAIILRIGSGTFRDGTHPVTFVKWMWHMLRL